MVLLRCAHSSFMRWMLFSHSLSICSFSSCIFFVVGRLNEPLFHRVPFSIDKNLALLEWKLWMCLFHCWCASVFMQVLSAYFTLLCTITFVWFSRTIAFSLTCCICVCIVKHHQTRRFLFSEPRLHRRRRRLRNCFFTFSTYSIVRLFVRLSFSLSRSPFFSPIHVL